MLNGKLKKYDEGYCKSKKLEKESIEIWWPIVESKAKEIDAQRETLDIILGGCLPFLKGI